MAAGSTATLSRTGEGLYALSGRLDFQTVPRLLTESKALFEGEATLTVDLAGVERGDSAGLALLLEWMRWRRAAEGSLRFRNIPDGIMKVAHVSDLEALLPID